MLALVASKFSGEPAARAVWQINIARMPRIKNLLFIDFDWAGGLFRLPWFG
jgi:hypothetical protein